MGATLFSTSAVASLAYWQRANMPDRVLVFRRVLSRDAGAVSVETYVYDRTEPCRLSLSRSTERNNAGTFDESRAWVLARPVDAVPLEGTEAVVVFGGPASGAPGLPFGIVLRITAVHGPRTFRTVQKCDVTTDGAPPMTILTTRARGPVSLAWSTSITATVGA